MRALQYKYPRFPFVAAAFCVGGVLTWAEETTTSDGSSRRAPAAFDHDPAAPADADIVKDFGLEAFYERFWGTLSVVNGNQVRRSDGRAFDDGYVGRRLCLKFADATRHPGLHIAGYYTIKALIDKETVELAEEPDIAVQNEAGYVFSDNEEKFRKLLATALSSGKVYKVSVPKGATFVLLGPYTIDCSKGGVHFVSEGTDDPYVGGAQFKFMREEQPAVRRNRRGSQPDWFSWTSNGIGPFDVVFENINLVARDNYTFDLEETQNLFDFPVTVADREEGFTLKVMHCDFSYEFRKYGDTARAYLAKRFGDEADPEALLKKYCYWARPRLIRTWKVSSGPERRFTWHLEYVDTWYVRTWDVSHTLFNKHKTGTGVSVMRNVRAYGSCGFQGRNGITPGSGINPLVDISADADGDFTVLTLSEESPHRMDFTALMGLYSTFSRKRPGQGLSINIEGVTNPAKDAPAGEKRNFIFTNQAKPRYGGAKRIGTLKKVLERGNGVYDLIINRDPKVSYRSMGRASGAGERTGGVTQYDYIASDRSGRLTKNETSDDPLAMISRARGYPNDYRGWVRYVYGDAIAGLYCDGGADWKSALRARGVHPSRWVWLDNDKAEESLKSGDKLCVPYGELMNNFLLLAVVEKDGKTVRYVGTGRAPRVNRAVRHNNSYIELGGKFYTYKVTREFVRNLGKREGEHPPKGMDRHMTWCFRSGAVLELTGPEPAPPGRYKKPWIWTDVSVVEAISEAGVGTRVRLDQTPLCTIAAGDEVRPGHPSNPAIAKLHYAVSVRVGNRVKYPQGKPFVEGETLYAYYLGTGADNRTSAVRLRPSEVILPKEWAVPGEVKNVRLLTLMDTNASGGTHWVYGKEVGFQYLWENVEFAGGPLALVIRGGESYKSGSVFRNCDLSYGAGMQLGGPLTVDGGKYRVYGGGGAMTVRNRPTLLGAVRSLTILDPDGTGYRAGSAAKDRR